MKTKILLTGMAKQTRINIQISIKIIAAKIQTTSWPKLDNSTPLFQDLENWSAFPVC